MLSARKKIALRSGRIGVISDTHGLARPEALKVLERSELILHAGDIGKPEVLEALRALAPVIAIRGNNDRAGWARKIPDCIDLDVNGIRMRMVHDVNDLGQAPLAGVEAVIAGHSHQPRLARQEGVLWINPGSAGPRRFKLPVAVARLRIVGGRIRAAIIHLEV